MRSLSIILLLALLPVAAGGCVTAALSTHIVTAPVADLRAAPGTAAQPGAHDPDEETQLLYGETVHIIRQEGDWAQVEAPEQPEWSHAKRWQGYPGWMKASDLAPAATLPAPKIVVTELWASSYTDPFTRSLSPHGFPMGARLCAIDMGGELWRVELAEGGTAWIPHAAARAMDELVALAPAEKRKLILAAAKRLIGQPYYWGGRSAKAPGASHAVTGVDCSGLVNLAYRTAGVDIPRDAHEQFLRAKRVTAPASGDLVFLSAKDHPEQVVHVMLYAGEGNVIEGPGTGLSVRRISLKERLGKPLEQLAAGSTVDGQTVYFGSYLSE